MLGGPAAERMSACCFELYSWSRVWESGQACPVVVNGNPGVDRPATNPQGEREGESTLVPNKGSMQKWH